MRAKVVVEKRGVFEKVFGYYKKGVDKHGLSRYNNRCSDD
jgi:hypothetical protein